MRWPGKRRVDPPPCLAAGERIYAVGDIHGRVDLLDDVLGRIAADRDRAPPAEVTLVFVGDYIDRGPQSAAVLDRLIAVSRSEPNTVCLRGNHEALLLDVLGAPMLIQSWAGWGGLNTLLAYGLAPPLQPTPEECVALASALRAAMPASHKAFLSGLPLYHEHGDFLFVHAGLRPHVPLAAQTEEDLLWIREDFLLYGRPHPKFVVHGHTPAPRPDIRPNRINIDTGAYATGLLTCLVLENETRRFL